MAHFLQLALPAPSNAGLDRPDFKIGSEHGDASGHDRDFKMPLYQVIVTHQLGADWWKNRDALELLRQHAFLFIKHFDLRIKDSVFLPVPLIRVERMNIKRIGSYCPEPDGYAIAGTIAFNEDRLPGLPVAYVLAFLLRFLLCAWQHQTGGDGTFDRACRDRMKLIGLDIDERGRVTVDPAGRFLAFLESCGVDIPSGDAPPPPRQAKSTLKVWSCRCQRARVGTKEFFANCPVCGYAFEIGDHVGKWPATGTQLAVRA